MKLKTKQKTQWLFPHMTHLKPVGESPETLDLKVTQWFITALGL